MDKERMDALPPDVARAARRVCARHGLDLRTLDYAALLAAKGSMAPEEYDALGYVIRKPVTAEDIRREGLTWMEPEPAWQAREDAANARILFKAMGLVRDE